MARQLAIIIFRWPYLRVLGCYNLCVYSTWHLKGIQILLHILYKEPYLESDIVTPKFCNFVWDFTKIAGWNECFYLHYYTHISISQRSRSRFTRDWGRIIFLPVILSSSRQISGLQMYQKRRPLENLLLYSSLLCGFDRRHSAWRNKKRNVASVLEFDHFISKGMKFLHG
jgi:hypothetical protein